MRLPRSLTAALLAVLTSSGAHALDKVTYQLGWIPTGEYAPYFAGVEKGFYKDEGIELVMSRGFGSGDTVKKVAGGGAMLGEADISTVMLAAIREKAPVKCLMSEYTQSPHSIFVLESSGIKSVKDLAGKKIATSPGNSHQVYFPLLARLEGIDAEQCSMGQCRSGRLGRHAAVGRNRRDPGVRDARVLAEQAGEEDGKADQGVPLRGLRLQDLHLLRHGDRSRSSRRTAT